MDFFRRLAQVVTGLAPILAAAAAIVCPGIAIAPTVLMALPKLIGAAEQIIGNGGGAIKKEIVMQGASALVTTMQDVSEGGQKETWEKLAPLTSTVVDAIVAGTKLIKTWDDPVEDINRQLSAG